MSYIKIDTKKFMILLAVIVIMAILGLGIKGLADNHPSYYANCSEAKAHHDTNIPRSSTFYRPQLDKDDDGYACE